jgi:hypothetical protein
VVLKTLDLRWHGLQGRHRSTINTIEDAIDESRRGSPAKAPGQLNPFIEDNFSWLRAMQQLECAQTKDIAIDSGHARQLPVVGRLTQPASIRLTQRKRAVPVS